MHNPLRDPIVVDFALMVGVLLLIVSALMWLFTGEGLWTPVRYAPGDPDSFRGFLLFVFHVGGISVGIGALYLRMKEPS